MKERPILFSAPMVRAILDGRKTQTRRVTKPPHGVSSCRWSDTGWALLSENGVCTCAPLRCPYGVPGDRLWVRETFYVDTPDDDEDRLENTYYRADGECCDQIPECQCADVGGTKWRPSIHMPRWASRITLEVTDVRVERLQDIGEADAMQEGVDPILVPPDGGGAPHVEGFRHLWETINGPGSWAANPWVWAITFKRVTP